MSVACARCETCSDADLALARAMGPLLAVAARTYLAGEVPRPPEDAPFGLTRAEEKLFNVLFTAAPHVVTYEVIFYSVPQWSTMHSLRQSVVNLRKKVGGEYTIRHVNGVGYRIAWDEPHG